MLLYGVAIFYFVHFVLFYAAWFNFANYYIVLF